MNHMAKWALEICKISSQTQGCIFLRGILLAYLQHSWKLEKLKKRFLQVVGIQIERNSTLHMEI